MRWPALETCVLNFSWLKTARTLMHKIVSGSSGGLDVRYLEVGG